MTIGWVLVGAVGCNLPIGYTAYKRNSLSIPGGVVAAAILGIILFITHFVFWVLLMSFFITSSLLTHYKDAVERKQEAMTYAEKGGKRDHWQVLANAGVPLILSIIVLSSTGIWTITLDNRISLLVGVSFAIVNADTWATELGVLSHEEPFLISNFRKKVPRGTSGGISVRGLGASAIGSLVIAVVFFISQSITNDIKLSYPVIILVGGVIGALLDSLLGATVQAQFYCENCSKLTEKTWHTTCQSATVLKQGQSWMRNDAVNFLSVLITCIIIFVL